MKIFLITLLTIFSFYKGLLSSALANQVLLTNVGASAWTDFEGQKKTLHIEICFRSTAVNNKSQSSNCLRLKSSMMGIERNENIIFETKNTQFKFKTNDRSKSGPNMKFWLKEKSNKDTINYYAFLSQLSKEENVLVGAMCKKVADMSWLRPTVKKAVNSSNRVNATIFKQFEIEGYRDINKIANRCYSVVEKRNGKIQFVKFKSAEKKKTGKCGYSKKVIFSMQSALKILLLYNSKVDGKYGPETEKAIIASKKLIFQFANRATECLSDIELKWLQLLASVKRKGQTCKKFNDYSELKDIAVLLEKRGNPIFAPYSANDKILYTDYDYLQVVYAIVNYENALSANFFKVGQRARDCRLIPVEKTALAKQVSQLSLSVDSDNRDTLKTLEKDQAARKADVDKARKLAKEAEERASKLQAKLEEQAARKADVDKARKLAKEAEERASKLQAKLEEQENKEKTEQRRLLDKLQREQEIKLAAEKKKIEDLQKELAKKKIKEAEKRREADLEAVRKSKEEELKAEKKKIEELEKKLAQLNSQNKKTASSKTTNLSYQLPEDWRPYANDMTLQQKQFCQLTDRFFDDIDKARKSGNEIKVNMVHKERQENFDGLLPGGNINNWIFKVVKIEQVEDGSAAVVLSLQCKSFIGSGQVYSSKRAWRTKDAKEWRATIPYNDRRFRELAKLDRGQYILASGVLLEINAFKPGQIETFYASQSLGEHPLTKDLNLEGELFVADLNYIAALN